MAQTIGDFAHRISEFRIIRAVNRGLVLSIPFALVGALCIALINFPIDAYQDFLAGIFSGQLKILLNAVTAATLDIIALIVLLAVSYSYSSDEPMVEEGDVHPLMPVVTTFCCYTTIFVDMHGINSAAISTPGRGGTLFALIMALLAPWLFFQIAKLVAKVHPPKFSALDSNLLMRTTFRMMLPMVTTILVFIILHLFVIKSLPFGAVEVAFGNFAAEYLGKESFISVVLTVLFMQLMWFVGINGGGVIFDDIMTNATLPGTSSMFATQDFYYVFVNLGGGGAMLGLLLALLIFRPGHKEKRLAKISAVPVAFNINEPLIFGMPIIFNPFYVIPFVCGPVVIVTIAYAAFASGAVPMMTTHVDWTTPIILSGFLTTGSAAGIALQIICLTCSVAIYAPFVFGHRRSSLHHRSKRIQEMQEAIAEAAETEGVVIISRDNAVGNTARELLRYIHGCFESDDLPFHLVFQPKTDIRGSAVGAEALLRWYDPDYGSISPLVLVELCDEDGLSTDLGRWVIAESMKEYSRWKKHGLKDMRLSINLDPYHLKEDEDLVLFLDKQMRHNDIVHGEIELEITEHMAIHSDPESRSILEKIRLLGIELAIDDMGAGYSSLTYISDFDARCIKIDISLVDEIALDFQKQEIVRSIVGLARQLGLDIIAEGVEQQEQVDALVALGVEYFQGYYFSKPLLSDDFLEYVRSY